MKPFSFARYALASAVALALISPSPRDVQAEPHTTPLPRLLEAWPAPDEVQGVRTEEIRLASTSPFTLRDVGAGPDQAPPLQAIGRLFLPENASARRPVPGVVLLHGASGVQQARELTYGPQLAAAGLAVLVVDVFKARRELGRNFVQRILNITETMFLADAFAALRYLDRRPEVDAGRVVLAGFSYGGMAAIIAAYEQVAALFAPDGRRFAGHVAFYAPCIARFEDPRTTGAPILMLMGAEDEIIDRSRCAETGRDLERGGSEVETIVYEGAHHQWDGQKINWRAPRNLAGCRIEVERDGIVRDAHTRLAMTGPFTRKIILGLCSDGGGYVVARDDAIRLRSNRDFGRFLARVLDRPHEQGAS